MLQTSTSFCGSLLAVPLSHPLLLFLEVLAGSALAAGSLHSAPHPSRVGADGTTFALDIPTCVGSLVEDPQYWLDAGGCRPSSDMLMQEDSRTAGVLSHEVRHSFQLPVALGYEELTILERFARSSEGRGPLYDILEATSPLLPAERCATQRPG